MAESVVYVLEVIDIGQDDGDRFDVPLAAGKLTLQRADNFRTVEQIGQEIVSGRKTEVLLQFQDAFTGHDSCAQLGGIDRLGQVIIGTRFHGSDEVLLTALRGEHHGVNVRVIGAQLANAAADVDAIHAGQKPVEQNHVGRIGRFEDIEGFESVGNSAIVESPVGQIATYLMAIDDGVLHEQKAHSAVPHFEVWQRE